jgi:hypothetical protein
MKHRFKYIENDRGGAKMAPISKTELCFIFIMVGYAREFAHAQRRRRGRAERTLPAYSRL